MVESFLIVSFLLAALFAAIFVIPGLMVRRAALKVIKTFCEVDALGPAKARPPGELGLNPPGLFERFLKPRDYKPQALKIFHQAGIVRATADGRLYMVQEKLNEEWKCRKEQS